MHQHGLPASRRVGDRLVVPDNIGLLHLPPYAPELNLVENVREFLRHNDLSNRVSATYEGVGARIDWRLCPGRVTESAAARRTGRLP